MVHCLPALSALRRALPAARIAWAIDETFAPLLDGHPDLDAVFPVRLRAWRGRRLLGPAAWRALRADRDALRRFRPDVALDLMGNHKGAGIALVSGARRTIGPARRYRREPSSALWLRETVATPGSHAVDRALQVLEPLGLDTARVDFGGDRLLTETPEATAELLRRRERPFVLIQAGAGWANKTYPAAWWGRVARTLRERAGVETLVPIAPGEAPLARAVADASDGAATPVDAGPFAALAALQRASRLVLGGDTGPIHLAHALGVPVLCLIGPTDPARNGPYGAPENVLWRRLPCSCCYRRYAEPKACLLNLTPALVAERALTLLDPLSAIDASV